MTPQPTSLRRRFAMLLSAAGLALVAPAAAPAGNPVGARSDVGCGPQPQRVTRLVISEPGVYENYLVDSGWEGGNRVKITADDVTLRNCEIRNASGNGVGVFGTNVLIENCRIHHLLAGSYGDQQDAHGITGRWGNVTIRNCEIYQVSGDCVQFDPDRKSTGRLLIEDCTFWTGPLAEDAARFQQGQRPGENAFDSKTPAGEEPCQLTMRNCLMYGWNQPGQISLMAALNVKENVHALVERCLFRDNEVCFRLRGPTGRGGAEVTISDCAIYDSAVGIRMEDRLQNLKVRRLGFGGNVRARYQPVGRGPFPGYENSGEHRAPPFERLRTEGFALRASRR